jgi:hypothetical protein
MAELITWNTCKLAFAQEYFNTQFEGLWLIYIALVLLLIHKLCEQPNIKALFQKVPRYHEQILWVSKNAGILLIALFVLYTIFIFKPDMTQGIIQNMANHTYYGVESHV